MPYEVVITDPAKDDLVDGYAFYESQDSGAGDYFLDCVYRDIDTLAHNGGMHGKPNGKHHRMICSRHPYGVFYNCIESKVQVIAIVDLRQHSHRIQDLLYKR